MVRWEGVECMPRYPGICGLIFSTLEGVYFSKRRGGCEPFPCEVDSVNKADGSSIACCTREGGREGGREAD